MELKSIAEIKDGLVVFMPSGIQATLYKEGEDILVEYPQMYKDRYTKEQFEKLIEEGIFVFDEHAQIIMEDLRDMLGDYYVTGMNGFVEGPFDTKEDAEQFIIAQVEKGKDRDDYSICSKEDILDMDEAYENDKDIPEGTIYKMVKADKSHHYLTAQYKIELLDVLTKIAQEYPDIEVRQQATTLIDEIGLLEYYDVKAVKDFIDKYLPKLSIDGITESLNEETGPYVENPIMQDLADELENGNKSGFNNFLASWYVDTSLDDKWEKLTKKVQDEILYQIAQPVRDGHAEYTDMEWVLFKDNGVDLTKEDLETLNIFTEEQLDEYLNGQEISCYITYEIISENDLVEPELEEAFKVRKNKKKKIDEKAKNEDIYLKAEDGTEEGPFIDQEAKEEFIKTQKQNGNNTEYTEIIKEEEMKINEEKFTVYSNLEGTLDCTCDSWDQVDEFLNKTWGEYKASRVKENSEFGTEQDKEEFLSNFEVAITPIEVVVDEIPAEGIELPVVDEVIDEPVEVVDELVPVEEEPCEDCLEEDFEDEHIGDVEHVEITDADIEAEEAEFEDLPTEEELADALGTLEDLLDTAEDAIDDAKDMMDQITGEDKEEKPEEELEEAYNGNFDTLVADVANGEITDDEEIIDALVDMGELESADDEEAADMVANVIDAAAELQDEEIDECMQKLPDPEKDDKDEEKDEVKEEFKDEMLTDVNDLDMPKALADTIDTKEDGSIMQLSDLAKEIQELKASLKTEIEAIKQEIKSALLDVKQDIKTEVNDTENKVDNVQDSVDDLVVEEDELEEPIEEEPVEEPKEEQVEESYSDVLKRLTTYKMANKAGSLFEQMALEKEAEMLETINDVKAQIDKMAQEGKSAEEVKNAIELTADNEQEKKQGIEYAIDKMSESFEEDKMAENIMSKLLSTSGNSALCNVVPKEQV